LPDFVIAGFTGADGKVLFLRDKFHGSRQSEQRNRNEILQLRRDQKCDEKRSHNHNKRRSKMSIPAFAKGFEIALHVYDSENLVVDDDISRYRQQILIEIRFRLFDVRRKNRFVVRRSQVLGKQRARRLKNARLANVWIGLEYGQSFV